MTQKWERLVIEGPRQRGRRPNIVAILAELVAGATIGLIIFLMIVALSDRIALF